MDNYLTYAIILILITLLYLANLPEQKINDFIVELPKRTGEVLIERKEILKRACKVAGELNQFATNGSSYETLLRIHRRVHNLSEPLWSSEKACYPANSKSGLFYFLKMLISFFHHQEQCSIFTSSKRRKQRDKQCSAYRRNAEQHRGNGHLLLMHLITIARVSNFAFLLFPNFVKPKKSEK